MKTQHPTQAAGRWEKFSLVEQLAHVGSEVERAINWKEKGNIEYSSLAFYRALELLDLTIAVQQQLPTLKELTRTRELLVDYFYDSNRYHSTKDQWQKYFLAFAYKARVKIG